MKASTVRFGLILGGLLIMMFILLSKSDPTAKSIGVILSIFLIIMGVVITGPLKKHFEKTKEGTMRPPDSYMDYR